MGVGTRASHHQTCSLSQEQLMIHVLLQFEELSNFDVLPPIGVWKARTIEPVLCHSQTIDLSLHSDPFERCVDSLSFMFLCFFPQCIRSICSSSLGNLHWMYLVRQAKCRRYEHIKREREKKWNSLFVLFFLFIHWMEMHCTTEITKCERKQREN